ncbi:MAG TPA: homoserine kinase [Mycobacteriales bacterium]|nr:homoserine kinase [Mycobacteriales bacterium]
MRAVRVRVPATSANLGPAFDSAALALTLYDEVVVGLGEEEVPGGVRVDVVGEGETELPRDARHVVVSSALSVWQRLGLPMPRLDVSCVNAIPQSRGLGSSAGAICAGLMAGRALADATGELDDATLLAMAVEIEGHPDNVAACLRGGVTLAWSPTEVVSIPPHPDLAAVAFVPDARSSTAASRGLLPESVPHRDAAANAARAALLSLALSADLDLLLPATQDFLHQDYRAPSMLPSSELVSALRADGVAAVISGAGPTVLALGSRADSSGVAGRAPSGWRALALEIDRQGAVVTPA